MCSIKHGRVLGPDYLVEWIRGMLRQTPTSHAARLRAQTGRIMMGRRNASIRPGVASRPLAIGNEAPCAQGTRRAAMGAQKQWAVNSHRRARGIPAAPFRCGVAVLQSRGGCARRQAGADGPLAGIWNLAAAARTRTRVSVPAPSPPGPRDRFEFDVGRGRVRFSFGAPTKKRLANGS